MNKQVRIRKNYFRKGYYSVHDTVYKNGKLISESLVDYAKTKKSAERIKRQYKQGKIALFGRAKR